LREGADAEVDAGIDATSTSTVLSLSFPFTSVVLIVLATGTISDTLYIERYRHIRHNS